MSYIKLCSKEGFELPEDVKTDSEIFCLKEDTPVIRKIKSIEFKKVDKLYRITFMNKRWDTLFVRPDEQFLTYNNQTSSNRIRNRKIKNVKEKFRFIIPYIESFDNYGDRFFENFNKLEAEFIFPIVKNIIELDFDKPNEFRRKIISLNKRKHEEVDKIMANIKEYTKIHNIINSIINFKNSYPFIETEDDLPVITSVGTMKTIIKKDKETEGDISEKS